MLASPVPKPLISIFILAFESHVCWWSWPQEHYRPIFEYIAMGERTVTIFLEKLVGVEVFSCRFAPGNKEKVISHQSRRICRAKNTVDHHGEWYTEMAYRRPKGNVLSIHINQDLCETGSSKVETHNRSSCDEGEEVAVVATTDAIIEPYTVMVLRLDAIIAYSAVVASRWAPDIAGLAILDRHLHGSCG